MKKLLAILLVAGLSSTAFAVEKKPATKPEVKKHQRFDGTKVADDKGTKPAAPAKKKK